MLVLSAGEVEGVRVLWRTSEVMPWLVRVAATAPMRSQSASGLWAMTVNRVAVWA
jgi:hypothetical protein